MTGPHPPADRDLCRRAGRWARIGLAAAAPPAFLLMLEMTLAAGGWFPPRTLLIRVRHGGEIVYRTNPEFGRWFFPRREIPMPSPVWVRAQKPPGVLRVVLIGESAAAGFPHPEFNLARTIEHVWALQYPHRSLEVVNLTMVGVNSHLLRHFAREARSLNPDVVVLYAGHNEAIGPFGPASVFGRLSGSRWLVRANLWVRNTRVGRAIAAAHAYADEWRGRSAPRWRGLDEFIATRIAHDDPRLDIMARHAAANFRDIVDGALRRGIKVVVAIPAINLTDWPPLAGTPENMDDAAALRAWRRGETNALSSAAQLYRLAKRFEAEGNWAEAWPLFRLAADRDLYRFRADRRVREVLESLRGRASERSLQVVDVDRLLHEENPLFFSDREYFCEHVHLTFAGRAAAAGMIVDALAALEGEQAIGRREVSVKSLAMRMLFTPMDEIMLWQSARELLTLGVFAEQPDAAVRQEEMVNLIALLQNESASSWDADRVLRHYEEARTAYPNDPMLSLIAGRWMSHYRKYEKAIPLLRVGLAGLPNHPQSRLLLAQALMALGRLDEAGAEFELAARHSHDLLFLYILRGEWHARRGELASARRDLEWVRRAAPEHYSSLVNLANVYMLLGEDVEAVKTFYECIRLNPTDPGVLNNAAWLLAVSPAAGEQGRRDALLYARRAVQLRADFPRYQASLALALAANGKFDEAREAARIGLFAIRRDGDSDVADEFLRHLARLGVDPVF